MQGDIPQVPVAQEVQPEVKSISQTPQQPPVVPQTPSNPTSPTKPKKWLKTKILIILITLIGLGVGGFFIWKNFVSDTEVEVYKGIWFPTLLLQDPNHLASNAQKLKDIGVNTIFIEVFPPFPEAASEKMKEIFPPGIIERFEEVIPIEKELIIANIQTAHRNGLKVALSVGKPPSLEEKDVETLNLKIIEYAKLAEEYDVELFAPMGEPGTILPGNTDEWRKEILLKIKKVYRGEIFWSGAMPGLPDKETISQIPEQPPGGYAGYDYIGFTTLFVPSEILSPGDQDYPTLEEYPEYVESALDYMLAYAERDNCKGVIITEFGVLGRIALTESNVLGLSEEEIARTYEIVFEKGKDRAVGFVAFDFLEIDLPGIPLVKENLKAQEVIREWFTEILPERKMISY